MAYLKGVDLSGSSDISGSKAIFDQITGSFITGSLTGTVVATDISTTDLTVSGTASIGYLETIYETASIIYSSGSTKFGDTLDDTHIRTGSLFITGSSYTINGEDIIITSALNAATSSLSSSLATGIASDSASLASSITTNSSSVAADIAALVVDSGSFSTRVTDLETFSSSLDDTFATEAELNTATASLSSSLAVDIAANSASISNVESFPYTGSAIVSGSLILTGSIYSTSTVFATASHAISSSYAVTASHALNVPVTSSYALTSSYVETAQTASYVTGANVDGTVQNAVSASYAPGGGVTSIVAGQGISINQSTGDVTISTDTIAGGSIASSSFANVVTTTLTHNFGSTNVIVATYDENGNEIVPASITLDSNNAVTATFSSAQSGDLVVIEAQTGEFATTSFSSTGSVTLNHSLGTQDLNVVAYDTSNVQFMPDIEVLDSSNVKATFASPTSGKLLAVARNESVSASYSNTVDETITHNLGGQSLFVSVYDTSYNEILPDSVSVVDDNNINITFAATSSGNVVIAGGVIDATTISTATTYTQAISGSSSYTVNHNLNAEWPLVQVYDSASRAQFVPQSVVSVNASTTNITFSAPFNGFVTINS